MTDAQKSEPKRKIAINPDIDAYEGFFDEEWKEGFLSVVEPSKLQKAGFDLAVTWESVSNARQLPRVMVQCVDSTMCWTFDDCETLDLRMRRRLNEDAVKRLKQKGETPRLAFWRKFQEVLEELHQEAVEAAQTARSRVVANRPNLWETFLKAEGFHTSLWASERMCYGALYYSYEWFLTQCVRIKLGNPKYKRGRKEKFTNDFRSAFGPQETVACLEDKEVEIARLTRNALTHNGGRITDVLQSHRHSFEVSDAGEIQIGAVHTTQLFKKLSSCVHQLAEVAVAMPEFQKDS